MEKNIRLLCRVCKGFGKFTPSISKRQLAFNTDAQNRLRVIGVVCDTCGGVGLCELKGQGPTLSEFIATLPKPYA